MAKPGANPDQVELEMKSHEGAAPPSVHTTAADVPDVRVKSSRFPILFERAAQAWWNPKFDSDILEAQHLRSSLPQSTQRFRFGLAYVALSCVVWCAFSGLQRYDNWVRFVTANGVLLAVSVAFFTFTFTTFYQRFMLVTSLVYSVMLCVANGYMFYSDTYLSMVAGFMHLIEVFMMMYTLIPLPLYVCVVLGVTYSVVFEALFVALKHEGKPAFILCRALLHFCIHLIGTHVFITSQVGEALYWIFIKLLFILF